MSERTSILFTKIIFIGMITVMIVEAAIIWWLMREIENRSAMNKGPATVYIYPKVVHVSPDIDVISRVDNFKTEHFVKDSANVVIIRYVK